MRKHLKSIVQLAAIAMIVVGFRLAAQAGQGLGVIQNDGYAGSGGFLILLGGVVIGFSLGMEERKHKKRDTK